MIPLEKQVAVLLLAQRLAGLPICPDQLVYPVPIAFESLSSYSSKVPVARQSLGNHATLADGATLILGEEGTPPFHLVLYNDGVLHKGRKAFTLAHEVGHILLGHTCDSPEAERQADAFAAELLMPRILVERLLRTHQGGEEQLLKETFGVSLVAARRRLSYRRASWDKTQAEKELLKRYLPLLPLPNAPVITI